MLCEHFLNFYLLISIGLLNIREDYREVSLGFSVIIPANSLKISNEL
jgi:hypothetical protein